MRSPIPIVVLLALCFAACKPAQEGHEKAIIGAVLIDGRGGPPLSDSLVVVSSGRIQTVARRTEATPPTEADRINGGGKFLVPAIVDLCDRADPPGLLHPATADEAKTQAAALIAQKPRLIFLSAPAGVREVVFEAAREANIPVAAVRVATQDDARRLVDDGAAVLIGMIRDTEDLDALLVKRLRDLRVVVAPALAQAGAQADVAARNTRRLFQAGVPLAVASLGGDPVRECELLAAAGIPPLDVVVAATHNGAMARRELQERGTIEPGRIADLLLLSANPGEDVRALRQVALRIK